MKKQSLDTLLGKHKSDSYADQYAYISQMISAGRIEPVKASPLNGKKPALHTMYWIVEQERDYTAYVDELLYHTDTRINIDYYKRNLTIYDQEREFVRALHIYLQNHSERLNITVSFNERCFEIWGLEKFLTQHNGKTILKHCGLGPEFLNCYPTVEPFAYYTHTRSVPQNILVLENKDPFYSMRQHLLDGNQTILGHEIGTLIYGGGKRVVSSFKDYALTAEPYMKTEGNTLLYFGDLDYEGIGIYENLAEVFQGHGEIRPYTKAYIAMLDKADRMKNLHPTKEQQNRNIGFKFFSYFDSETVARMKQILKQDLYIPQEILNISDF